MRVKYIVTGVLVLAAVLLIGPYSWAVSTKNHHDQDKISSQVEAPILVQVAKVSQHAIPNQVTALGTLSAVQTVTLSSESDGRIAKIYFKNGQQVAIGMPIIQLDNAATKAAYDKAVTQLDLDRSKLERSLKLPEGTISKQDMDALHANVASDAAEVKSAQALLDEKEIDAPFSGTLGKFLVNEGDYIKPGDPLVDLVNSKQLRVDYNLDESLLPQLKQGQLVQLTVSAYPQQIFYGTVSFISPTINQNTRTVAVQALVSNNDNKLSPGMFAHVTQQINVNKNALVVPQQAIMADVKGYYVFKLVGNRVSQTYINVGVRVGDVAEVLANLKVGDVIVTAGQQKLQDGSVVTVAPSDD